ncbi:MAG: hypothetical protein ACQEQI_01255 [Bacillota bacterium]
MDILRYGFRRDLLIWLIVVIIVGSSLASGIGYLADNYFGDTVNNLLGDYGKHDFLITVNQELDQSVLKEIRQVRDEKLPQAQLTKGVTVAGKSNYFLQLASDNRTKEVFSQVDDYFEKLRGVENVSLIAEPKISLQGMVGSTQQVFADKINQLAAVNFVLPTDSGLEIMLKRSSDLKSTREQIEKIIDQQQLLQIRFPIVKSQEAISALSVQLRNELQDDYDSAAVKSLNVGQRENLDDLIKSMTQMKQFLLEYATIVELNLPSELEIDSNQTFALASQAEGELTIGEQVSKESVLLTPLEINNNRTKLIIKQGDGTKIANQQVYLVNKDQVITKRLGQAEIKQPRYLLSKAVSETKKLVPQLQTIVNNTEDIRSRLKQWIKEYNQGLTKVKQLESQLSNKEQLIEDFTLDNNQDLKELAQLVSQVRTITTQLESSLQQLNSLQSQLVEINSDFKAFERNIEQQIATLSLVGIEDQRLSNLKSTLYQLKSKVSGRVEELTAKINQQRPLLNKLSKWNNNLTAVDQLLTQDGNLNLSAPQIRSTLTTLTENVNRISQDLDGISYTQFNQHLAQLKESVGKLDQLNFKLIIKELDHLQQRLPNLSDEEITSTINLLDEYLAGKVLPGEVSYFLVDQSVDQSELKEQVQSYFAKQGLEVNLLFTAPGLIKPNVRGEFFRILGEVRALLTAVIGLVFSAAFLLIDQSLVLATIQRRNQQYDSRLRQFLNSSYLYGFIVGGLILSSIFYISQAKLPFLTLEYIMIIGGLLGILTAHKADAINPIDEAEFAAGEALGLNYTAIMHEIVIPSGRPGLLRLLNSRKMSFK